MAPHGGGIEPGTSEIADAIAGEEHAFYAFEGLKVHGNAVLHLPSVSMDEPKALLTAEGKNTIITVHGCRGDEETVYIGGLDSILIHKIQEHLQHEGFTVSCHPNPDLRGVHPNNLCNLSGTGKGVQLEIPMRLRRQMFPAVMAIKGRKQPKGLFWRFVGAIRQTLK
jgi:phage replication-related protein YjqB (UPF0714/DUF867 family)